MSRNRSTPTSHFTLIKRKELFGERLSFQKYTYCIPMKKQHFNQQMVDVCYPECKILPHQPIHSNDKKFVSQDLERQLHRWNSLRLFGFREVVGFPNTQPNISIHLKNYKNPFGESATLASDECIGKIFCSTTLFDEKKRSWTFSMADFLRDRTRHFVAAPTGAMEMERWGTEHEAWD